ncbi:MAG: hypothetical protein JWP37_847 [Mucilaginibacter sp.]|nr:hypothetical protein [Mucilaginibacter sp.]
MELSLTPKIVIFIILALFTAWPYFEKFKDYSIIKRILIGTSIICLIAFGIWDIFSTDSQLKKDKLELEAKMTTTSQATIDSIKNMLMQMSNAAHTPQNIAENKSKNSPILRLATNTRNYNPYISRTFKEDSSIFNFTMLNKGNATAFHLGGRLLLAGLHNGKFYILEPNRFTDISLNKNFSLFPNEATEYHQPMKIDKNGRDTMYVFMKVDYEDSINHKNSYVQIFTIHSSDLSVAYADEKSYYKIENLLLSDRILKRSTR